MTILIFGSAALGLILGRFFKVLVLVPAIFCLLAIAVGRAIYFEHSLPLLFLEIAAAVTSLQIGYAALLISLSIKVALQRPKWLSRNIRAKSPASIIAARHR
ncbi:MAG: hypothetical protein L0Y57_00665 [Beijerinckiaceae bacterium]|nr:hypothetical protein [Beijerinckiaceae bacterium]